MEHPPVQTKSPIPESPLDHADRQLCDLLQRQFPLAPRPFAALGQILGWTEQETLERIERLKRSGLIRQISAIFDSARVGYRGLLAAFHVPSDRLDDVAAAVAGHDGVSHAYERDHHLNFWFTLTCPPGTDPESECARMAEALGVSQWVALPATATYKIGVVLPMVGAEGETGGEVPSAMATAQSEKDGRIEAPCPCDQALIRVLQQDLPLVVEPFREWADELGLSQEELLDQARSLIQRRMMRRFAAVLRHRQAGFRANGMACWDAPGSALDRLGPLMAENPAVSHCYARRPSPPLWPYNLFAMIHGRSAEDVALVVEAICHQTQLPPPTILFSGREFKKSRVRYYVEPAGLGAPLA